MVAIQPGMPSAAPSEPPQEISETLVAGGLAPDRAEWIADRSEALLMAQIEARHAAERAGDPLSLEALERLGPQYMLREELGDWEYEQYLQALGRPTTVGIPNVLANSPAARAGLTSGDQIVAYDGTRVFNVFEVTEATRQGTVGEPVILDIVRDGQPMQFIVPRGPLGVALSGNGLPSAIIVAPSSQGGQ
jgi:membrane-associated protease RseP (regulator of RpoE activity)